VTPCRCTSSSALIFNQNGLPATVGADDKVLFKKVTIARDLGKEIELASIGCG
jgi:hypothetical protein